MKVRAKFKVTEIRQDESGYAVKLWPVCSGSAENEDFYKYTPAGSIELSTINVQAAEAFAVGGEYYVDFTRAK